MITHNDTKAFIYPLDRQTLHVKVKCQAADVHCIYIVYWNKFTEEVKESNLNNFNVNGFSQFFSVKLSFDEPVKYISYYFVIKVRQQTYYYAPYGLSSEIPKKHFEYASTNVKDIFTVPGWAKGAVGYQIFPERFSNGDDHNDPTPIEEWHALPTRDNFFGGDLRGIINKLNHLVELGIDLIYLTPIFHSPSNHKYDTIDYFTIDPSFGSKEDLQELIRLCHSHNMKVVLDGVFHHIGYYSQQFQDVIKHGRSSKYWDWFYIHGESITTEPLNYECVGYYKWMPKLNFANQEVRDFVLSVGEYWIKEAGIDGWRLDVADEVDFTFWQEFRNKMKRIDRDILLIGETWKNGQDLIRGDQMDTIMNYRFRDAVIDYFAYGSIDSFTFMERLESTLFDYPLPTHNVLYNLLDSHDTARFLTTCHEDKNKFMMAVVFQMTFIGMPFIYYGDEIGMTGNTDPDCRKPMSWHLRNHDLEAFYKKIIHIRKNSKALKYGTFRHILCHDQVYSFIRETDDESVIVFINPSSKAFKLLSHSSNDREQFLIDIQDADHPPHSSKRYIADLPVGSFEILNLSNEGGGLKVESLAKELHCLLK